MRYIGLDIHYGTSTYCVLNENGRETMCETVRGHWPKLMERLRTVAGPWTICFEATCGYGYLYRELSGLAQRVVVALPGQENWGSHLHIYRSSFRTSERLTSAGTSQLGGSSQELTTIPLV